MKCPNCNAEVNVCVIGDPTIKNICTCPKCNKDFTVKVEPKPVSNTVFTVNPKKEK